ncbi:hypothetical protein [Actinophytocola sp.]|uniref:hypothetical protein n=1 Tax=Actinophytocola sp. TaxID=1872138 RepID=UPI002D7F85F3|nr:hypothetical protein [Actinophytocola sp.]HET9142493.1 hypothetical protein [Actinophytocola sp.]
MTTRETSEPFDEAALRALFDAVEAPAALEAAWQGKVALRTEPAAELAVVRPLPDLAERAAARRPTARVLVAAVAALAVGGGIAGVIAANQRPKPDPDQIVVTIEDPTTTSVPASQTSVATPPSAPLGTPGPGSGAPAGPGTAAPRPGAGPGGPAGPGGAATPIAPARGPLAEWPNAGNTGVPAETRLQVRNGDWHITQAGAVIADWTVNGTIYIDAPDVTLRRVRVAPSGDVGVRQSAPRLRIEDSEVGSGAVRYGVRQEAPGLVVQRSDITASTAAVWIGGDATIVDSNLSGLRTPGNASRIMLRHNTIGASVTLLDQAGPVTEVTIDNNQIGDSGTMARIYAPSNPASHHILVTGNRLRRDSPSAPAASSGWNAQAPGNIWTGNVWSDTSEPASP